MPGAIALPAPWNFYAHQYFGFLRQFDMLLFHISRLPV